MPKQAYRVILASSAAKELRSLPKAVQTAVVRALEGLSTDPRTGKPLVGALKGLWSLRRGDYRVIYRIDDTSKRVEVARVSHRSQVYRGK